MPFTEIINFALEYGFLLVNQWGYLGLFVIIFISHASLFFFPIPAPAILFAVASVLDPLLTILVASTAAVLGDTISYFIGLGGKEFAEKKYGKELNHVHKFFEKKDFFIWIFILSSIPFPIDLVGIFCGIIKYDLKKYFLASFAGKLVKTTVIVFAGYYSLHWLVKYLGLTLIG